MIAKGIVLRPGNEPGKWELSGHTEDGPFVIEINFNQLFLLTEQMFKVVLEKVRRK